MVVKLGAGKGPAHVNRRQKGGPSAALSPYWGLAASGGMVNRFSAAVNPIMWRKNMVAADNLTSVKLVLANFWQDVTVNPSIFSAANMGSVTYAASIEYPAGTFTQVKFGGATTSGPQSPGSLTLSDATPVSIAKGDRYWPRVFMTTTGSVAFDTISDFANGDRFNYLTATDQTMGGTITDSDGAHNNCVFPLAVIGLTTVPSVILIGDSRIYGTGGAARSAAEIRSGQLQPSIPLAIPSLNLGRGGESAQHMLDAAHNQGMAGIYPYCTDVVIQPAGNDLFFNNAAYTDVIGYNQAIAAAFPAGVRKWLSTCEPYTTSSDGWTTTGNQALAASGAGTPRANYNDAVRAGVAGFTGYFEAADQVESARNSGLWAVPTRNGVAGVAGAYTADGVHANGDATQGGYGLDYVYANPLIAGRFTYP